MIPKEYKRFFKRTSSDSSSERLLTALSSGLKAFDKFFEPFDPAHPDTVKLKGELSNVQKMDLKKIDDGITSIFTEMCRRVMINNDEYLIEKLLDEIATKEELPVPPKKKSFSEIRDSERTARDKKLKAIRKELDNRVFSRVLRNQKPNKLFTYDSMRSV